MTPAVPVDGLVHPYDLGAWRRWEGSHHRARRAKAAVVDGVRTALGRPAIPDDVLSLHGTCPQVLVVVDAPTSSQRAALLAPLAHMLAEGTDVAVVSPAAVVPHLPGDGDAWTTVPLTAGSVSERLETVHSVLAVGHYLPLGAGAYRWAQRRGARFIVVQHGLLTPFMAPLPAGAHLLAWSAADAAFWASGRTDITYEVVGSQLLWRAAQEPRIAVAVDARPTFLGQLHGVELGRRYMTRVSEHFCTTTGARYRPHPSERDRLSRLTHARWEHRGIDIDRSDTPLFRTASPVVSVFSTGILEAAARGIPAWCYAMDAPSWLVGFQTRYNMSPWYDAPTSYPLVSGAEPAAVIARTSLSP
ncbi:hypothetical protein [Actinomyces sp. MRS3W]|uniref:hypothetical protein n=1 Tax=Actinomyces sp. MRS3W TaxID=2800796 RepID=UPI0028FD5848|nr:hypothetical protein [Actinomyces sp. MRS3W]MDU0347525.1 hypothetical protein [Actinomyces sp. MRS3W]